jgi:hypothetical protein
MQQNCFTKHNKTAAVRFCDSLKENLIFFADVRASSIFSWIMGSANIHIASPDAF